MNRNWQVATTNGDLAAIGLLARDSRTLNSRDEHGQTALMNASKSGALAVVQLLVALGANLDAAAKYGLTALMLAIVNGHRDVARCLIVAGADLARTGSGAPGFAGKTALDLARARGQHDLCALIEERSRTT